MLDGHVTPVDLDERGGQRRVHHVGEPDGDPLPRAGTRTSSTTGTVAASSAVASPADVGERTAPR